MPVERRRKPSIARMAERGFPRESGGGMPAANARRDGMGKPVHFDATHGNPGWIKVFRQSLGS